MPGLCHFFGMQPSEVKALTMRELGAFTDYMRAYQRAQEEAARG